MFVCIDINSDKLIEIKIKLKLRLLFLQTFLQTIFSKHLKEEKWHTT